MILNNLEVLFSRQKKYEVAVTLEGCDIRPSKVTLELGSLRRASWNWRRHTVVTVARGSWELCKLRGGQAVW